MKSSNLKWVGAIALVVIMAACQDATTTEEEQGESSSENHENELIHDQNVEEGIVIQGLADHYHTGDAIQLTAELDEETEFDHWHWYIKNDEESEWETVPNQESTNFSSEATVDGQEIKAILFDDEHEAYVQSAPVQISIDDHEHGHSHAHDEESQKIYEGYFEDDQIEDRTLTDWTGDWQSVYPYLQSGELDEVFAHKAEHGDMTEEEYKDYYEIGYETDVDRIVINDHTFTFFKGDEEHSGEYSYDGYEVLTYEKGNRGVRYIFKLAEDEETNEMPQYIQFSDHSIFPTEAFHFHLYWGDDREALLDEVTNWPTYYPSEMDADEITHEMIAH